MKVLLINPPSPYSAREAVTILPPLGLLSIGAVLEASGHEVRILDAMARAWRRPVTVDRDGEALCEIPLEESYLKALLARLEPQVVGISCLFATAEESTLALARTLRRLRPELIIIVGGTNASVRHAAMMRERAIDYVVLGEGEHAVRALLALLERGEDPASLGGLAYRRGDEVLLAPGLHRVESLDELPFPAYHLLEVPVEEYFQGNSGGLSVEARVLPILTSRGCVLNCAFCAGRKLFGKWRARAPARVLEELEELQRRYGIREVAFIDSNVNLDRRRFTELLRLLEERALGLKWIAWGGIFVRTFDPALVAAMKRTGCYATFLSVEAGDPAMQRYIGKIIPLEKTRAIVAEFRRHGIWTHGNFVIGLPGETEASMQRSFGYATAADFDSVSFHIAIPLPGSRFFDEVMAGHAFAPGDLRFKTEKITWSAFRGEELSRTVQRFMLRFVLQKALRELGPRRFLQRLRSLDRHNLKLYWMFGLRFVKNLWPR